MGSRADNGAGLEPAPLEEWREAPRTGSQQELLARRERERRVSSLALRYRSGERAVLGELYAELEPMVRGFLRTHISGRGSLPSGVDAEDLCQQSYVVLAETVLEWEPERRDNFMPYFFSSFPWRLDRYLRSQTPLRRTARFQLRSVSHDSLVEQMAGAVGLDGREWDDVLGCAELLRALPGLHGRVVELYLYHGLSFAEVGDALGISRSAAHRAFGRAISLLRSLLDGRVGAAGAGRKASRGRQNGVDPASLRRCVEVLHRLAPNGAPLPGGKTLCRAAGLTQREYRGIMAKLCALGCVVDRGQGRAGRLACASASETIRLLLPSGTQHSGLDGRWS